MEARSFFNNKSCYKEYFRTRDCFNFKGWAAGQSSFNTRGVIMSEKYDEYFESKEANEDSKSDARVALIVIIVFVVAVVFWVSGQ